MKNKIFSLTLFLILLLLFASCGQKEPEKGKEEDEGVNEVENFIYTEDSELYLIVSSEVDGSVSAELDGALSSVRTGIVNFAPVDSALHKHEIVLGNTDREISKTAMSRLGRIEKNDPEDLVFLIYSDGYSVAIVYESDDEGIVEKFAVEYFINNYIKSTLVCEAGTVYSQAVNVLEDYYGALDKEYIDSAWDEFEKVAGKELTDSFKKLYSLYSSDMLLWMANLYDPDICVCTDLYGEDECSGTKYCGTAGFYFTNSARDTIGYLPDVESTNQTLNFLSSSGIGYKFNNNYAEFLPSEMLDKIGDFVIALQEPNGYFYHPQWGIEFTDGKVSRRSRDLNWSESILKHIGRKPIYDTPNGMKGTGVVPIACKTFMSSSNAVGAVSKVLSVNTDSYDPNLQDLDSFKAYLEGLDIRNRSYHIGNDLTSQSNQIVARDKQIGTPDDPTPLMDYLIFWLNENQNPETGHWDYKELTDADYDAYYGVNGLLKISGIYTTAGEVFPNAMNAAKSAMAAITDEQEIDAVVDLYNTWFSIRNLIINLRECGGAEGLSLADEIIAELRLDAPHAVEVSRNKISVFKKLDGSFSYTPEYSSSHAQGCPAAVPNSVEGDVNGNNIASTGLVTYILGALDLLEYSVPMFGEKDRRVFLKTIEELSPINKVEDVVVPDPMTFDYDEVGENPEDATVENSLGSIKVVKDPTGSAMGNVVRIISQNGGGDKITFANATNSALAKTAVFEGDFCIEQSDVEYSVQFLLKNVYMMAFKVIDGKVHVREVSSSTSANGTEEELGIVADLGNWFSLKVEYYPGDHNSVRIKVYADTDLSDGKDLKLMAVSDNYYDNDGTKYLKPEGKPSSSYTGVELYVMSKPNLKMYIDNFNVYSSKASYTAAIDPNNQPFFNIDSPDKPEVKYTFDSEIPDDITVSGSGVGVSGGALSIDCEAGNEKPAIVLPLNVRTGGARCASVSFDLNVEDIANGARITIVGKDGSDSVYGIDLVGGSEGVYFATVGVNPSEKLGELLIEKNKIVTVKLEYYHSEDRVFVYLDGKFVGESKNLYVDGYKRTMDAVLIGVSGDVKAAVDNVVAEKTNKSFSDAVKPIVDPEVWKFDHSADGVTLSGKGASHQFVSGDGVVELNGKKGKSSLTIGVNNRATLYTLAVFEAEINISDANTDGVVAYVNILAKNGKAMAALALVKNGASIGICQVGVDGVVDTPLYNYSVGSIKLYFEMFGENKVIHIYNNGVAVAKTSILLSGEELLSEPYGAVRIENGDAAATLRVDDVRFETLYELYSDVKLNAKDNPEKTTKDPITFEYSSTGNIPSPIGGGLSGTDSQLRVERVEKDGDYSNALAFYTVPGANDFLTVTANDNLGAYSVVAFEADVMLDLDKTGDTTCYQMYFSSKDSNNRVYMFQLTKSGDSFKLYDKSDFNNDSKTVSNELVDGIRSHEWFRLKVEYFRGSADTVRFRISINGEVVSVSDNFFGSQNSSAAPASAVECFYFYTLNKCDGTIFLDNVRLYGFNGICSDGLTVN